MIKEYPMRVVSKITGLSADQIRKWEERYPILKINRSRKGSRRFTDRDLEILQLMNEAKSIGFTLQEIGTLKLLDLRNLVGEIRSGEKKIEYPEIEKLNNLTRPYFDSCIECTKTYNVRKLEKNIYDVALELGNVYVIHKFIIPFIKHIGRLWKNNLISKSQERFANAVIRNYLENYRSSYRNQTGQEKLPSIIIATPKGQKAELGCLVNACITLSAGWNPIYLGTDLDSDNIVEAFKASNSKAIILSILYPLNDEMLPYELVQIRKKIGPTAQIIIGGKRSTFYMDSYKEIAANVVTDLFSLPNVVSDVKRNLV